MAAPIKVEKLLFCAREMHLALCIARHAPSEFVGRAIARHVVVRARDFIALAFDALGELRGAGVQVENVRARVAAYRDAFDEYYDTTRTKLGAHVQPIEFRERLELWTDLEVVKLSYFVDGARETYDALCAAGGGAYPMFATFPEAQDGDLLSALEGHAGRNAPDAYVRFGADVLAASRANTVSILNFTPVHQRAGELAAINTWVETQWAMLQVCAGHTNVVRILKARIITDVVSFADCLTTRLGGDPTHQYSGLDDLLRGDGDPSAIDQFKQVFRLSAVLDQWRQIRNHLGAHLHRDDALDLTGILRELDGTPLGRALLLYERLRAVFYITCRRTHFLTSYLANGAIMAGVAPSRSPRGGEFQSFDAAAPEPVPPQNLGARSYDADEIRREMALFAAGGPTAEGARQYLWNAFTDSPALEDSARSHGSTVAAASSTTQLRRAHAILLERLTESSTEAEASALLDLAGRCARGYPDPLAETLLRHYEATDRCSRGPTPLRGMLRALGSLPIESGGWARAPLVAALDDPDPLVVTEAANGLYRRLFEDRVVMSSLPSGTTAFGEHIVPACTGMTPKLRLLVLVSLTSMFTAGEPSVRGAQRESEFQAVFSALKVAADEVLDRERIARPELRSLLQTGDMVGVAQYVSESLSPRWEEADVFARAFVLAATQKLVAVSAPHATQSLSNLALAHLRTGDKLAARRLAEHVMRVDPLAVDAHLALVPVLIESGVPREIGATLVDELVATSKRRACTPRGLHQVAAACAGRARNVRSTKQHDPVHLLPCPGRGAHERARGAGCPRGLPHTAGRRLR